MARPSDIFKWCIQETDSDGNLSRENPPPEIQLTGTLKKQPIFRPWLNQMQFNFSSWIQYFAAGENDPIGSVKLFATGTFATDALASEALGGTWVVDSTNSAFASNNYDVYRKTSLT